jgi:hypothetical protein
MRRFLLHFCLFMLAGDLSAQDIPRIRNFTPATTAAKTKTGRWSNPAKPAGCMPETTAASSNLTAPAGKIFPCRKNKLCVP